MGQAGRSTGIVAALALAVTACSVADETVFRDDLVVTPSSTPATVVVPATTGAPNGSPAITIERAWSPENALAELSGVGAVASDAVTVDGGVGDIQSFDVFSDGSFVVRVRIADEGAHTVCVRDACSRVFTRASDADSEEDVAATIAEARTVAADIFDGESALAGWTIEIAGPQAGTGGSTDTENRVITVHSNRDRTVDEFVVTILHEWGHAIDVERLTEDDRLEYRRIRGYADDLAWRDDVVHAIDDWSAQPGEDFAEVLVAAWTADGIAHRVRTSAPAGPPDAATLALVLGYANEG